MEQRNVNLTTVDSTPTYSIFRFLLENFRFLRLAVI